MGTGDAPAEEPNEPAGAAAEDGVAQLFEWLLDAFRQVLREIGEPDVATALPFGEAGDAPLPPARLAQATTVAFQLLRLAEELNAARERCALRASGEGERLPVSAERALSVGHPDPVALARRLRSARAEPVLTAHPTEAKRQTVMEHHRELYGLLRGRPPLRREILALLERLWRTGEIFLEKPDLDSELRQVRHYLTEVVPDALPTVRTRFAEAWAARGLPMDALPPRVPRLRFGTWVGGDRDGHPLVTAEVTRGALATLRADALALHRRRLRDAAKRLSLSSHLQPPSQALLDRIDAHRARLGPAGDRAVTRNPDEPWRQLLNLAVARIDATATEQPGAYGEPEELADDLRVLHGSLRACGAGRLARAEIDPLLDLVDTFGFAVARLDIRQNSAVHERALADLMGRAGLTLPADEPSRLALLRAELDTPRPFTHDHARLGPDASSVIRCFQVLADEVHRRGPDALGALIVSMTRRVTDLLAVYLFAREVGLWVDGPEGPVCPLPVVPLFETIADLEGSAEVTAAFLEHPLTARSLAWQAAREGLEQPALQVMIGYSDSNKDGGLWASRWGLHRAQARLTATGRTHGVRIRFFHGRGGTISRGAGPVHRFLRALPPGSLAGDLRLTEQGEVLSQRYASAETAAHHLESLLAGVVEGLARDEASPDAADPLAPWLDALATRSRAAYTALVRAEGFVTFFGQATPIDAIEVARIGSRPARRSGERSLDDLRAIPWVFAWSQARFALSGWYGTGSAWLGLRREAPEGFEALRRGWSVHPTLHDLIRSVAASIVRSDPEIMRRYASLVPDRTLRHRLLTDIEIERARTMELLETLYGGPLAQRQAALHTSMARRAAALTRLHDAQIRLLGEWRAARAAQREATHLEREVLLTVNAIAAGLGATG